MRGARRRVRARLAAQRKEVEMGFLDALCEGAFVRRPDGSALFFPWGALGRGYLLPAGASYTILRRSLRRLLAAGLLAAPAAALVAAGSGRLALALWLAGAASTLAGLGAALLTRGLAKTEERLGAAEARARIAAALGEDAVRRIGLVCLLAALAGAGLYAASVGGELLGAASGAALAAAGFARGLLSWKRRTARPRSAPR